MNRQIIIIITGAAIVGILGSRFFHLQSASQRVDAVGNISFTFNGLPPQAPLFTINDIKPGDCYTRDVIASNQESHPADIGVSVTNQQNADNLSDVLNLTITTNQATLYTNTVTNFFHDSTLTEEGMMLTTIPSNQTETYHFTVCMPTGVENEWQNKMLSFDITFGQRIPVLPAECQELSGFITHAIWGSATNDQLRGTNGNDLILGLNGNDRIDGNGGNDCLVGGEGNDTLNGNPGNDILIGNHGNDTLKGDDGNDRLYGNEDKDTLMGNKGDDYLDGGSEADNAHGNDGVDTCINTETTQTCNP